MRFQRFLVTSHNKSSDPSKPRSLGHAPQSPSPPSCRRSHPRCSMHRQPNPQSAARYSRSPKQLVCPTHQSYKRSQDHTNAWLLQDSSFQQAMGGCFFLPIPRPNLLMRALIIPKEVILSPAAREENTRTRLPHNSAIKRQGTIGFNSEAPTPVMAEKGHPFWKMCLDIE